MNFLTKFTSNVLRPKNEIALNNQSTAIGRPFKDQIRFAKSKTIQGYKYVCYASNEYRRALKIDFEDIHSLDDLSGYVEVTLSTGEVVHLRPSNVCGVSYGASWELLILPCYANGETPSIGGGTSQITALEPQDHLDVLQSIGEGRAKLRQR